MHLTLLLHRKLVFPINSWLPFTSLINVLVGICFCNMSFWSFIRLQAIYALNGLQCMSSLSLSVKELFGAYGWCLLHKDWLSP